MGTRARFVALALAFLAVSAFAAEGTYVTSGNYGMAWGGNLAELKLPSHQMNFTASKGPPRTIVYSGVTYTWDAEDECYREPFPGSDSWSFDGMGNGQFSDYPTYPASGPPVTTVGLVYPR